MNFNNHVWYRQFLVNSLKLPSDITNHINSYLFYDHKDSALIQQVREVKETVMDTILDALSRSTHYVHTNYTEEWTFIAERAVHLAATNCRFCGNYISSTRIIINPKIYCFCEREPEYYDDEEDEEDEYPSDEEEDDEDEDE